MTPDRLFASPQARRRVLVHLLVATLLAAGATIRLRRHAAFLTDTEAAIVLLVLIAELSVLGYVNRDRIARSLADRFR